MSEKSFIFLEVAKTRVSKLKWNGFKRDFANDSSSLQDMYWKIIVLDLLFINNEQWNTFPDRFCKSFLGTFYKANELYIRLRACFEGVNNFEWERKATMRTDWEEILLKTIHSELIILRNHVGNWMNAGKIQRTINVETISLQNFDQYHKQLGQRVSHFLKSHVRGPSETNIDAIPIFIELDKSIIRELHSLGETILKAYCTRTILLNMNFLFDKTQFDSNEQAVQFDIPVNDLPVIRQYSKVSGPTMAYKNLILNRPHAKEQDTQIIANMIKLMYRDNEGKKFKTDSIHKAIKRIRKE